LSIPLVESSFFRSKKISSTPFRVLEMQHIEIERRRLMTSWRYWRRGLELEIEEL